MLFKSWLRVPSDLFSAFLIIFPIITSQILQRLFPIIDNRYFNMLGSEATYLHNIQYNFVTLGQFIGLATYISSLVFWKREDCLLKQGNILIKHILASGIFTLSLGLIILIFLPNILMYYHITSAYYPLATMYFKIGLINMVIQAIFGGLDGMLVGTQQQKYSMFLATFLLFGNWIADYYAVFVIYSPHNLTDSLYNAVLLIGLSTTTLLSLAIIIALILILSKVQGWKKFTLREMLPVWWGELGVYLIRGIVPFIFAYQLFFVDYSSKFLTTYQFLLHITYLFCFPSLAAMQVAIRDSACYDRKTDIPGWWNIYCYTGFVPTSMLMILGAIFAVPIMHIVYGYDTPINHIGFLVLFFISSWIGQVGNTLTIPLRIAKKSYLVTKNFFLAELVIMLGGTQLIIMYQVATATTLGYISLLFTISYTFLNWLDVHKLNKTRQIDLLYEKAI